MAVARPETRRAPRRAPARRTGSQRRHLQVIPGGLQEKGETAARKPARPQRAPNVRFMAAASMVTTLFVFGVVVLNIILAQSSFELQRVHEEVAREEARYRQMRYQVATAEAPAELVEAAAAIGLVAPDLERHLLGPPIPSEATPSVQADDDGIKAILSKQP